MALSFSLAGLPLKRDFLSVLFLWLTIKQALQLLEVFDLFSDFLVTMSEKSKKNVSIIVSICLSFFSLKLYHIKWCVLEANIVPQNSLIKMRFPVSVFTTRQK